MWVFSGRRPLPTFYLRKLSVLQDFCCGEYPREKLGKCLFHPSTIIQEGGGGG